MTYVFDLIGISPMLDFFHHEQAQQEKSADRYPAYLGVADCALDLFLSSADEVIAQRQWNRDQAVDAMVQYWVNNRERVKHWGDRLRDAGKHHVVIGRVADVEALQLELESILYE